MRRRTPALAAIGITAVVLAGCSGSGGGTTAFTTKLTTSVPAAKHTVEHVTWNLPTGEPTSLDPALSAIESNSTVVGNLCESLQTRAADGSVKPALATSIDASSDHLSYAIHLRQGVRFWDGQPMTADDVAYSIQRVLEPALGSSWAGWAGDGATVAATGSDEVTVTLKTASSIVPNFFATPAFAVVEKAFAEKAGSAFGTASGGVMCTGPYKLDAWSSGSDITVERNTAWWDTAVTPLVEKATFTFTTDASAETAALRSGSLDGAWTVPVASYSSLQSEGHLLFSESYGMQFLPVLDLKGGLADLKTRKALQKVVDYAGIAKSVYRDTAEPIRAIVPPSAWGAAKSVYQAAYDKLPAATQDLAAAKKLLKESSYDGATVVLAYPVGDDEETKMATVIASSANGIGLKVKLKPMQPADYSNLFGSDPAARAGIDAFVTAGYLDFPDPTEYYQYFTTGNYYNFAGYSNAAYDAAMASASAEFDPTARAEDVTTAQAIIGKDLVNIPLVSQYVSVYYAKKLAGLAPSPSYLYVPWLTELGGA